MHTHTHRHTVTFTWDAMWFWRIHCARVPADFVPRACLFEELQLSFLDEPVEAAFPSQANGSSHLEAGDSSEELAQRAVISNPKEQIVPVFFEETFANTSSCVWGKWIVVTTSSRCWTLWRTSVPLVQYLTCFCRQIGSDCIQLHTLVSLNLDCQVNCLQQQFSQCCS